MYNKGVITVRDLVRGFPWACIFPGSRVVNLSFKLQSAEIVVGRAENKD
jgi:hypothetical protein